MVKKSKGNTTLYLTITVFFIISFLACGEKAATDKNQGKNVVQEAETVKEEAVKPDKQPKAKAEIAVEPGWQTVTVDKMQISLPKDWNGDNDANVWWPGEGSMDMGLPPVCVHVGGIPVMPGSSPEDRMKGHMISEPTSTTKISKCGMDGNRFEWEVQGTKHMGIFLKENISGSMIVLQFVNCRAPAAEYEKYKPTFQKILASVRCSK